MREIPILFSGPMVRAILDGRKTQTRRVVKPQPPAGHVWNGFVAFSTLRADEGKATWASDNGPFLRDVHRVRCPYGQPGDRLWARETYALEHCVEHDQEPPHADGRPTKWGEEGEGPLWLQPHYRSTDKSPDLYCENDRCRQCREDDFGPHWRPSIHMPRWASRITLEVTGVHVERLQDMDGQAPYPGESDALAEGVHRIHHGDGGHYFSAFRDEPHPKNWSDPVDAFRELWESINGAGSWATNPWVWVVEFRRCA